MPDENYAYDILNLSRSYTRHMKKLLPLLLFVCLLHAGYSQSKFQPLDKSPMDMAYYPANFPILKIQDKASEPLIARVVYSRPQKNGRTIFGDLVEYGKVWRMGANEATEIEFFRDVKLGEKKVKKGRYTIYALVNEDKWTIILNKETDIWGAFKYDETKDILRTDVPVQKITEPLEDFSIAFEKNTDGANLWIGWDDTQVRIPFTWK